MTSFSTRSKFTLPPPFAATFGDRRPDLLSWRDLYTDAILFQSGREAGNLARSAKHCGPPITPFSGASANFEASHYSIRLTPTTAPL